KDNLPLPKEEDDPDFYLSIMHSTPLWLVKRLKELFGEKEAKEIISYKNKTNTTCLRPNFMNISKEAFEEMLKNKGWEYTNGILPNAYLVKGVESIAEDADYLSGKYSVQGQSSMLVVEAMDNKPGMYVLDACAAPGGKALYLAEKQQGSGRVYAWDIHNHRVDLIRSQMYRLSPGNVRVANCDARVYRDDMYKFFDAVLVDVPCSNTGVILDKPDVKYNLKADEMPSLLDLQADILDNCAKYVKPGGVLIYSTCSIMPEENEQQVKKFLENNPNFKITSFPENFPENLARQTGDYGLQILPHKTGLEGFFIARMVRDNEY
ncbi:MAG: methyltransferase domain-containing protein, partial [Christensenellaceae bacterium]|nr:methyltransferase domain-containing protein [Christensenellaceae bacterium]